jgi:3-hydroxy-9,10-secoandrosta-1,3,5(10)-triene-9,17-dione monooxygenase
MSNTHPALFEDLMNNAKALKPYLIETMPTANEARKVPEETIKRFIEAGLFRMLQPASFGGYEMNPKYFYDVVREVSSACPSSGWVLSVLGVHNWEVALLPEQTQREVWGEDDTTLICSSYMPVGKVERVDGGYTLSGHWYFSSGCDHSDWAFLGGMAPPENEGEGPALMSFLVPKADFKIDDDWHVSGLKASGSKGIIVEDAFIPSHRGHSFVDGFMCVGEGQKINKSPIYKLPFGQVFTRAVSQPAIGAAQGALDTYIQINNERVNSAGSKANELPATISAAANADYMISNAVVKMQKGFDDQLAMIDRGEELPTLMRSACIQDSARGVQDCLLATQELLRNTGGRAVFSDNRVNLLTQDIMAIAQHFMNESDKLCRSYGAHLMGGDNSNFFL